MEQEYLKAQEIVKKYHQEQLLNNYEKLSQEEQKNLLHQINTINFTLMEKLYQQAKNKEKEEKDVIEPISYIAKEDLSEETIKRYVEIGEKVIKRGEYAVVTMAGGQGTRLGHPGPKGTFDLGLPSHKSLFEMYCNRLKKAEERYHVNIPWYIMTSKENYEETVGFFKKNNYFDYEKENIIFFKQGQIPMLSTEGKILLNEKGMVKEAADGHGGVLSAMEKEHVIEDMKKRGIKWITIVGVDNVLVKMVDPFMLGITIDNQYVSASKSTLKANPEEKVGVFCKRNGRPSMVEYIEISKEMTEARDEKGGLIYGDSNIIYHLFQLEALEPIIDKKLPYHIAFKKANYLDEKGNIVIATEPNAYKFETFIFDSFSMLDNMLIVRTKREEDFAPIKNAKGVDSPNTARELYIKYFGGEE